MSKTAKHYNIRDRICRYKQKIVQKLVDKYYTASSKSQQRKDLTGNKPEQ